MQNTYTQQTVQVEFDDSSPKQYTYLCRFPVKVGERVIVDTPSTGLTTVTVVAINQPTWPGVMKEVVNTLRNVEKSHKKRLKTQRKLREVSQQVEQRLKQAQSQKVYAEFEELLGDDEVGVKLLKKMQRLEAKLRG